MERFLFRRIEAWVVLVIILLALLGMAAVAVITRNEAQGFNRFGMVGKAVYAVASAPSDLSDALNRPPGNGMAAYLAKDRFAGEAGWTYGDVAALPDGYLLFSRFDGSAKRHRVSLVDLATRTEVAEWPIDADRLLDGAERTSTLINFDRWTTARFRAVHPLATPDGDLIVKDHQSPLMRINACGGLVWRLENDLYHHSTEADSDGNLWLTTHMEPQSRRYLPDDFYDDAIVKVSPAGKVLHEVAMTGTFRRQGLASVILAKDTFEKDPMHINDVQPIPGDGTFWKKGDVFISMRSPSMVLLYRPSTDTVIWSRQGPWAHQHDVDVLDDHRIAVFNNNSLNYGKGSKVQQVNDVVVYDFSDGSFTSPWAAAFRAADIRTLSEGLQEALPGGGILVEEENAGRLLILAADGTPTATFINRAEDGVVYSLGWSRFLSRAEGDAVAKGFAAQSCG